MLYLELAILELQNILKRTELPPFELSHRKPNTQKAYFKTDVNTSNRLTSGCIT